MEKCHIILQVTILTRRADDEVLLLASDGLWDVLNNQEACTLAKRCLRRARQRGASRQSAARIAATVLTRAAVDRGSRDNVTVCFFPLIAGDSQNIFFRPLHAGQQNGFSKTICSKSWTADLYHDPSKAMHVAMLLTSKSSDGACTQNSVL